MYSKYSMYANINAEIGGILIIALLNCIAISIMANALSINISVKRDIFISVLILGVNIWALGIWVTQIIQVSNLLNFTGA